MLGSALGAGLFLLNLWVPFALAVLLLAVSYGTLFSFFGDPCTQAVLPTEWSRGGSLQRSLV